MNVNIRRLSADGWWLLKGPGGENCIRPMAACPIDSIAIIPQGYTYAPEEVLKFLKTGEVPHEEGTAGGVAEC